MLMRSRRSTKSETKWYWSEPDLYVWRALAPPLRKHVTDTMNGYDQ